jgi:hypothetical protein
MSNASFFIWLDIVYFIPEDRFFSSTFEEGVSLDEMAATKETVVCGKWAGMRAFKH